MKLIIANWKLHPKKYQEAQKLAKDLNKAKTKHKVVLCPPFVYLPLVKTKFDLGAQDIFWQDEGAYTGEISASMLKQFKVKYAIVGHSERRGMGETDEQINAKLKAALAAKIQPVLCVGYGITKGEDEAQVMLDLRVQLEKDLEGVDASKLVVAYEPVWAISHGNPYKGKHPSPEHAERVAMFIKMKFKVKKVLYGGSVEAHNAQEYLDAGIDGLLVGGASLKASEFTKIIS